MTSQVAQEVVMPESKSVVDPEEQRETGAAWMVIGGICWLVAFVAMFFHPAAWKLGRLTFAEYAGVLAIVGAVVFVLGWRAKRKASE
jgi:energy-converting hydrogenase Eha subunit G